jgi:CelD/BcsL family acetyltransferase involved in cellulose biosynthesis
VTDYLDPLVDAETAGECWSIMLELLGELWDWSVGGLDLHNIPGDSTIRRVLPTVAGQVGFDYREKIAAIAPYIPLPATWEEYLAKLDGHERKEIKRKVRNAQTKGNARWVTATDPADVAPALERALAQMRQAESTKADFTEEILIGFLRRTCPHLSRQGDFFIQELWIEGKPSAWLLALRSDRGPMIYNTSYDFGQRQWSPGIVSFSLAIQQAIAGGHPVFNLLRGGEEYKKRLGAIDLELMKISLRPK